MVLPNLRFLALLFAAQDNFLNLTAVVILIISFQVRRSNCAALSRPKINIILVLLSCQLTFTLFCIFYVSDINIFRDDYLSE
jgi:hypothetical protein